MKKLFFIMLGVGIILILSQPSFAQYELSYTGNVFQTMNETQVVDRNYYGYVSASGQLRCQINFPYWATGYRVSRISATVTDNSGDYIGVGLNKVDRWTGTRTTVGYVMSSGAQSGVRFINLPGSSMSARGIDNNRYAFYIYAYIGTNTVDLKLHSVTIRWE